MSVLRSVKSLCWAMGLDYRQNWRNLPDIYVRVEA